MKLVIVESPNKIKKIESILGSDFKVIASYGHILDLSTKGQYGLGIDLQEFIPDLKISTGKSKVVKEIQKQSALAEEIYIATDPDREGEAIAYHITRVIMDKDVPIYRSVFNSITEEAVKEAIANPIDLNLQLVDSQETRRMLDRMIGFRLSALTRKKLSARSAGRVKSSTLKLIIERERERSLFIAAKWNNIESRDSDFNFYNSDVNFKAINYVDPTEAKAILDSLSTTWEKIDEKQTIKSIPRPKPFEMSSYMIAMFNAYGFSTSRSSRLAQTLYEKGLITYPRTDSTRVSSMKFLDEVKGYVTSNFGADYYKNSFTAKTANSQDAHEAIRPTSISFKYDKLDTDLGKAYSLILKRTIKAFMIDGKNISKSTLYKNNGHLFTHKQSIVSEYGFRSVDGKKDNPINFEDMKDKELDVIAHETKPPAHFNQASIVKEMKDVGIGRPSTYASTLSGLISNGYIEKDKGKLIPTIMSNDVNEMLEEHFDDIIDPNYTSKMEKDLDAVAEGQLDGRKYVKHFWRIFEPRVESVDKMIPKRKPTMTDMKCPECSNTVVIRRGKFGEFYACSNFPKCKFTDNIE